jgi:hypothetical protein
MVMMMVVVVESEHANVPLLLVRISILYTCV